MDPADVDGKLGHYKSLRPRQRADPLRPSPKFHGTSHRNQANTPQAGWDRGDPVRTAVLGRRSRSTAPFHPITLRSCSNRDPAWRPSRRGCGNRTRGALCLPKPALPEAAAHTAPDAGQGGGGPPWGSWAGAAPRCAPGSIPGGPHTGDPSQEPTLCARRTARPEPRVSGPLSSQVPSAPLPSQSFVRKDA